MATVVAHEMSRASASSDPGPQPTTREKEHLTAQVQFAADGEKSARSSVCHWDPEPGFAHVDGDIHGPGYNETKVDIIAVPCPGASPVDTWTREPLPDRYFAIPQPELGGYQTAKELPGSSILSPAINRHLPRANHLWIRHGLRTEISTARVLLYRHRELTEGVTLEQLANDLLEHVARLREGHERARPIFFICHSIGGLVAKQALVKASQNENLRWILFDCHGMTFFATPHRGSSYLSKSGMRDSIQHLLYLSKPLPMSITNELRLNNQGLLKLHELYMDIASEMHIWTFYETIDSQLSGLGASDVDEVHFSAPIVSIKSSLVGSRNEQAFSLESEHADCASFGPHNIQTMQSYLQDLSQAVNKAVKLSSSFRHTPLRLGENVKLELIGFYDDPDPETISDIRLYISKRHLNEFLEKGPEHCLRERLNTIAPKPRQGQTFNIQRNRTPSLNGAGNMGFGGLGILGGVQDLGQRILGGASPPDSGDPPTAPEDAQGLRSPDIVVTNHSLRPLISGSRVASEPAIPPRGLTVPSLMTPGFNRPSSLENRSDSDGETQTLNDSPETETSPRTVLLEATEELETARDTVSSVGEKDVTSGANARGERPLETQDPAAGFSRPDPKRRKFIWIHLPYNNPHWVKTIFEKLSESQNLNYSRLLRNEYWADKHVQGRHGQTQGSYVRPGCGFVPAETQSPKPYSPIASGRNSPALHSPTHFYLYLPYLHYDTYLNLIRRRNIITRRMNHGRTRPVPRDISELPLDLRVIWEYIGHDPPLNTRRTLDQYSYPSLRDTWARDDDQMLYKLTKEQQNLPFHTTKRDMVGTRAMKARSAISPAARFASAVDTVRTDMLLQEHHESPTEVEQDLLDGNVLMVDQLWLWAVDTTTLTTFFPKRESHPTEGPMFQQADLRNSVYNELNGDLTGRCENALDLAAFITLHAITVLLERTSHPDLDIFRIFEEAIGILTERMTSSLKRFRMQTFKDRIHDSDSDNSDLEDSRTESIKQRHQRELEQAERENRENTSALLELRDMDDELKSLRGLFAEQAAVVERMRDLYGSDELREHTAHGRTYLDEALGHLADYDRQVADMATRVEATRKDYDKLLGMVQRQAQVDEVRWSRLQTELASTQNLSVMIFTTFTVVFLPLSFFTSLFGMNTAEWSDGSSNFMSLRDIGAISIPASAALIAMALVGAFSGRVQNVFKLLFRAAKHVLESTKGHLGQIRSKKHKEAKLRRQRLRQERKRIGLRRKERGYDFWETVRLERRSEYTIPELNRKRATKRRLEKIDSWLGGH